MYVATDSPVLMGERWERGSIDHKRTKKIVLVSSFSFDVSIRKILP
jgi:hypothetical protein